LKICVLGTHSLLGEGPKVGTQHIAEILAQLGHRVTYVTAHSSWPSLLFPAHRSKYLATFKPLRVADRLVQITPVNFLPVRVVKRLEETPLRWPVERINAAVERTRGRVLEEAEFDLCIFSAATTMTLLPKIRARHYVYRVNDLLSAFAGAPKSLVALERTVLERHPIDEVCAVNEQIAERISAVYPRLRVRVLPNGVDLALFDNARPDPELEKTRRTNIIYVGWFDTWTNIDLVFQTAACLPDHNFHLFGTWNRHLPAKRPANVLIHGPIRHREIASKMKGCCVGLIPSGPQNTGRLVEKPLKFYEYLAAGLGVAATTYGGKDLEPFALIADDPRGLAAAILEAKRIPERHREQIRETLRAREWRGIVRSMVEPFEAGAPS
jgi:glycosyltransferase involved in cell wall biosynthesis